jgi:hypothetical protein
MDDLPTPTDEIVAEQWAVAALRQARDIRGMILGSMATQDAECRGKNRDGQRTAHALENHCGGNVTVGSNPTPSALTSQNRF